VKNWWEDFLEIETHKGHEELVEFEARTLVPLEKQIARIEAEEDGSYFNLHAIDELELEEEERDIFMRMDELHFQDVMRLFTLGMYMDLMHQQGQVRADLFRVVIRLQAGDFDEPTFDALNRKKRHLERQLDWLVEETNDVRELIDELGYMED
jgi:hypothetical protein